MLEELILRIKLLDRGALVRVLIVHLRAIKEDPSEGQLHEHLEVLLADPSRSGYFTGKQARLAALRKAVEELESGARGRDELPPLDGAALRTRLRHAPRVIVGLPQLDRALLDNRGDRSYVWLQDGTLTAIGPEWALIDEACRPYRVVRPAWQGTWAELTSGDANPWRPPGDGELQALFHAALERTFAGATHDSYGQRHPLAAIRAAIDEWAKADARELVIRLTAAVTGEARAIDAGQCAGLLGELSRRHGALPGAALVPLLLGELGGHAAVEIWPTPPGLRFDLIGATRGGHLRARAVNLRGVAAAWHAIGGDGLPRGTHLFEGGNVVLALSEP